MDETSGLVIIILLAQNRIKRPITYGCPKNQLRSIYNQQKKKDFVMIEQENNQRLLKSRVQVPDKIEVDGAMRIPCHLYPDCKTVFIKALGWFHLKF